MTRLTCALSLATLLAVSACEYSSPAAPVTLRARSRGGEAILTVVPAGDLRINARVPPAVELAAGGVVRLVRGRVSPDSSYFLEPPWEVRPSGVPIRGRLRVSFCRPDEAVCRSAQLPVNLPE
jgi:hypothetical protein